VLNSVTVHKTANMANPRIEELPDDAQDITKNDEVSSESDASDVEGGDDSGMWNPI